MPKMKPQSPAETALTEIRDLLEDVHERLTAGQYRTVISTLWADLEGEMETLGDDES